MFNIYSLVNLTLEKGQELANKNGFVVRVTSIDGRAMICTMDYNAKRINVGIVDGLILSVSGIG